jgi:hypothetical protein
MRQSHLQGSTAHRAGFAAVAALAGAVVLVVVLAGSFSERGTMLLQDDVNHDSALGAVFTGHGERGTRGRHRGRALNKDATVSDFFKAALDGDFSKGGAVKDATDGIFDNRRVKMGLARAQRRRGTSELKAPRKAREQALAETKLRIKAAHAALAAEAHADRRALQQQDQAEKAAGLRVVANSRESQMLALMKKKEQKLAQKYPSEDKFVARYTGSVPSNDVPVDSFTFGSYVPI